MEEHGVLACDPAEPGSAASTPVLVGDVVVASCCEVYPHPHPVSCQHLTAFYLHPRLSTPEPASASTSTSATPTPTLPHEILENVPLDVVGEVSDVHTAVLQASERSSDALMSLSLFHDPHSSPPPLTFLDLCAASEAFVGSMPALLSGTATPTSLAVSIVF